MDTSDSECFESADEEIYPDDDETYKKSKVLSETQKDLYNLNLVDSATKLKEQCDSTDTINNELNANLKPTQQQYSKTDGIQTKAENNELINDKISERNKLENEDLQSDVENNSKTENTCISTEIKTDKVVMDEEPVKTVSNESEHQSSVARNKDISDVSHNVDSNNLKKETPNITVDNSNKDSIEEELQKISDSDENMWENDDWEPVSYEKDIKVQDNNQKHETPESKSKEHAEDKAEENMWDNDDWESFEKVEPQKPEQPAEPSWSGWGNWGGVSSIFTTATQGVTTLTNQVSQGLTSVLETSMGIPDPKQLAKLDREQESMIEQHESDQDESTNKTNLGFGFGNLSNLVSGVSHITKFVENTGNKVITGGLDTLETIGKKTMEVLQEGDPGLKNKRALLKLEKEKPILSHVLREAKEKAERENQVLQEKHAKKKMNYETLFDDYHGLVHLEALEMLSKQCDIKLETLSESCSGTEFQELQETMDQIKELCEIPDEDDEDTPTFEEIKEKIQVAIKDINVSITYEKLVSLWEETEVWLNNLKLDFCDENEIHQEALQVLAQLTAIAVEQFHKCGELLLIKEHRSTADEADSLVQLTMTLTSLIGLVAGKFSEKLNMKSSQSGNKESINSLITNVFFEAGNSSSYIQDAFQLLIPVLQVGAV
ncbi:protein FAM114A2 [Diabrotica virgifera virgifera]|uniref:Protein FAM114A2 n=1 Tax=Diabrotica virgifera virgifera TaxID=50390 RepID=A0A6P7FB50_DIAVI|nr:protein FAM114A2 [Diabrotica virgifera virgifera]